MSEQVHNRTITGAEQGRAGPSPKGAKGAASVKNSYPFRNPEIGGARRGKRTITTKYNYVMIITIIMQIERWPLSIT